MAGPGLLLGLDKPAAKDIWGGGGGGSVGRSECEVVLDKKTTYRNEKVGFVNSRNQA